MEVTLSTQYVSAGVFFVLALVSGLVFAKLVSLCTKSEAVGETYGGKVALSVIIAITCVVPCVIAWICLLVKIVEDLIR